MPGLYNRVTYSSADTSQQDFLAAIKSGETGSNTNPYVGFDYTDLTNYPRTSSGFPISPAQYTASGPTHAAGLFQFEPSTWQQYGASMGLDFSNPQDQSAAAWYDAQNTYYNRTGQDLETALQQGQYDQVANALKGQWPSITTAELQKYGSGNVTGTGAADTGASATSSLGNTVTGAIAQAVGGSLFVRIGLIVVGAIVILVALWMLLSKSGVVPSPQQVTKTVGKAATAAVVAA